MEHFQCLFHKGVKSNFRGVRSNNLKMAQELNVMHLCQTFQR
uniref:Uncharacterized protein n=1 Tax=Anguilla anguilla TaxID=7936 RepID=A0A0E9TFJ1_ANGAN